MGWVLKPATFWKVPYFKALSLDVLLKLFFPTLMFPLVGMQSNLIWKKKVCYGMAQWDKARDFENG